MIDLALARQHFTELLEDQPATLYAVTTDSQVTLPAIIVGQPSMTFATISTLCERWDVTSFPIMIVVRRPGTNDPHQQAELEQLWTAVAQTIADELINDESFGGVCKGGSVTRAEFSFYTVQGQQYPTQTINVELYG